MNMPAPSSLRLGDCVPHGARRAKSACRSAVGRAIISRVAQRAALVSRKLPRELPSGDDDALAARDRGRAA